MSKRPVLILQMQRMGDLILSFPLFLWLERIFPGHPVWVVAEENFFRPLMSISPRATYIPWNRASVVKKEKFEAVINLSIRNEAAQLAYSLDTETLLGPFMDADGSVRIKGNWQLYRAAIVQNNRHNLFHWADLNALDIIPLSLMQKTGWPVPRTLSRGSKRVGLFLGASEISKRPTVEFWAGLCREFLNRGFRPVLFGGPLEKGMGAEVARIFGGPVLDMSGRLNLGELAAVGQSLQILITPDTGPMHLASWTGLKVLNLSMGNVNPHETGPYQPGNYVLRSNMSCARGCWSCTRDRLYCHDVFTPAKVAFIAGSLIRTDSSAEKMNLCGQDLYRSGRNSHGLYSLSCLNKSKFSANFFLSEFWSSFFMYIHGLVTVETASASWNKFQEKYPLPAGKLKKHLPLLGKQFSRGLFKGQILADEFWDSTPLILRSFTGYVHLLLQNCDYSKKGWSEVLNILEKLVQVSS
ncbi:glycosyltransferase family 9 protein [Maridesulfovibrio bastinii]|uniref:glycosyltransferase family 9 protein n=1 Tax=Maridesulfovibrio bastinii TaxID=47157 RepID=UPI000406AAC7|nr:glycosyltransferase family 9 protein [Maridesulfovibrio bastinii]